MNQGWTTRAKSMLLAGIAGLGLLLSAVSVEAAWYNSNWQYRKAITLDGTQIVGTVSNYPVPISITDSDLTAARADGFDILFTDGDQVTKLDHEIEKFSNGTGELVAWVKIPSLTAGTDKTIYIYYGYAGVGSNQENVTGVWDSSYEAVYHLHDDFLDSTANNHNATNNGTTDIAGKYADGQDINGGSFFINSNIPSNNFTNLALSVWFKSDDAGSIGNNWVAQRIITDKQNAINSRIALGINNNRLAVIFDDTAFRMFEGSTVLAPNTWYHGAVVYDGTNVRGFLDGVEEITTTTTGLVAPSADSIQIGRQSATAGSVRAFNGQVDEVRISNTFRPVNWIQTVYSTTSNPSSTIKTTGAQEDYPPVASSIVSEISPNDVYTYSVSNSFEYASQVTINTAQGDSGFNRINITIPSGFGTATLLANGVTVNGSTVAATGAMNGSVFEVSLTSPVTTSGTYTVKVQFTADGPTSIDPFGVDFTSTFDHTGNTASAMSSAEGNGDGDAGDNNSWTVTTSDFVTTSGVQILDGWTSGLTHSVSAGSDRLLVFVVNTEHSASPIGSISGATYGGQALTKLDVSVETGATAYENRMEMWYLKESGIAAAVGNTFAITGWTGNVPNAVMYHSITLQNVDQTNPVRSFGNANAVNTTTLQLGSAISAWSGDLALYSSGSGDSSRSLTPSTGYVKGLETDSAVIGAGETYMLSSSTKSITTTGTEQPTATWNASVNRLNMIAAVFRPPAQPTPDAVTSAIAEISPNDVARNSPANVFTYNIKTVVGSGQTGFNRIVITVPSTFGAADTATVTAKVGSSIAGLATVTSSASNAGNVLTVDLNSTVSSAGTHYVQISFASDAPSAVDAVGKNFTSTISNRLFTTTPFSASEGDADDDATDNNTWTVITRPGAAADNVVAEIYPHAVAVSTSQSFDYDFLPTIGGGTGINRMKIVAPTGYTGMTVIGVSINGSALTVGASGCTPSNGTACPSYAGQDMTVDLHTSNKVVLDVNIKVTFTATAPAATGSADFTSTVDDSGTTTAEQNVNIGDGDADAADGNNQTVTVTAARSISGRVFLDANFTGTPADYGAGDSDLANVDVELYDNLNNYIRSTTTAADGSFSFTSLADNQSYKVRARVASIVTGKPELTWANGALLGGQSKTVDDSATADNAGPGDNWNTASVAGADISGFNFGFAYTAVTNTSGSGQGSLTQVLADISSGNTVYFDPATFIPGTPATINLASTITMNDGNVAFDGSNAGVILDGSGLGGGAACIDITSNSNSIRGLQIQNCPAEGIKISSGTGNTIGGDSTSGSGPRGQGNTLILNGTTGVTVSSDSNFIYGNLVGTDGSTDQGNTSEGIYLSGNSNTVGSATAGYGNVVSGNNERGILVGGDSNTIKGNRIGTDSAGTSNIANTLGGIRLLGTAQNNVIGGTGANEGNLVAGNASYGISHDSSNANTVSGNTIGGAGVLQNTGIGVVINSGTLTIGDGMVVNANGGPGVSLVGGAITFAGTIDINDDVTLAAGSIDLASASVSVTGNWNNTGATVTAGTSTVTFDGNTDQTISTNSQTFNNLALNNTGAAGSDDVIISGSLDINGNLTITDGDLDIGSNNPTINLAGNLSIGANGSVDVTGRSANWIFDGTTALTDSSSGPQDLEDVQVTGTVTLGSGTRVDTLNITGTVNLGGSGYVLQIDGSGTPLVNSGAFNTGTSTVRYSAGAATNITNLAYNSLQLSGASTFSLLGNQSAANALTGNLTVDAGATLDTTGSNFALTAVNVSNAGTITANNSTIVFSGNWNNTGTFTAGGSTVQANGNGQSINGSTTFNNFTKTVTATETLTFQAGQAQTFNGTVTLQGSNATNLLSLRSGTPGSQWSFVLGATATKSLNFLDVQDSDASAGDASQIPVNPVNSNDSGNNIQWFGGPTVNIRGYVYSDEGVTTVGANNLVRLVINGTSVGTDNTNGTGLYSINAVITNGDVVMVYLDGEVIDATTVTVGDGNDMVNIDLYANNLILREDNIGTLTNADLVTAQSAISDTEILYTMSGNDLTVSAGTQLYVPSGFNYVPGGTVSTANLKNLGTINFDNNNLTVSGTMTNEASGVIRLEGGQTISVATNSMTAGSTVIYDGTSGPYTVQDWNYQNLTFEAPATVYNLGAAESVAGNLTITDGTLDISGNNLTVTGTFSNDSDGDGDGTLRLQGNETVSLTMDTNSGIVEYDGTGTYASLAAGSSYYNLAFSGTGSWDAAAAVTVNNNLTISNGSFDLNANNLSVTGSLANSSTFRLQGGETVTLTGGHTFNNGSTVVYDGTAGPYTVNDWNYRNLIFSGANGVFNLGAAESIAENLTIVDGTFDINGNNLTVSGTFSNDDDGDGDGTLRLQGGETVSLTMDTNSGTVEYDGTGSYVSLAAGGTYYNLLFNGTGTWNASATTTANNNLTITDGIFDINGNNLTVTGAFSNDSDGDGNGTLRLLGNEVVSLTMDTNSGTVEYDGTGSYASLAAGNTYYDVLFNGTGSWQQGASLTVNNDLTISSGTLNSNGQDITLAGNWSNSGTYTSGSNTVVFNGTGQSITGSNSFNNLTKNVSANDTLTVQAGSTQTVNGALTLNGTAAATLSLRSSVAASVWNLNLAASGSKSLSYLDVQDSSATGSAAAQLAINPSNSVDSGNTPGWFPAKIEFTTATASDNENAGGNLPQLRVTGYLGAAQTVDVTVTGGTATAGDYSNTVTVNLGAGTYTNTVVNTGLSITGDSVVENDETIQLGLTNLGSWLVVGDANSDTTTQSSHTYTILNDDGATASISGTTGGFEPGTNGQFTVSLTAASGSDTTVSYIVVGASSKATSGSDYTALSGSVVVPAGSTSATIDVAVIDDTDLEGTENLVLQLTGTDNGSIGISATTASIDIFDNESATATIAATTDANETGPVAGRFTVTLSSTPVNDVAVSYSVLGASTATAGTDYTALSGSVTVSAGSPTAFIDVTGVNDDALIEGGEIVRVQITSTDNLAVTIGATDIATINILDNDTTQVSIATTTNASETGPTSGRFTVSLGAAAARDVTVNYSVLASSTATAGTDYTALSGSVIIAAGSTSANIDVIGINDDALAEGTETVVVQLTSTNNSSVTVDAANDTATVNITDNDVINASVATTTNANETGPVSGRFTVSLTAAPAVNTTVSYNVLASSTATAGGTDYTSLSGSVVVNSGSTTAFIDVAGVVDDSLVEGAETVVIQLTGTDNANVVINGAADTATVNIADNDTATASIAATTNADETGPANGQFTVTLTKAASSAVTVNYSVLASSTATAGGTDYTTLSGSVVVAANSTTATIDVTGIVDDALIEGTETVVVQITSTSNALVTIGAADTATVNIADNDTATASIAATTNANETGPVNGQFTVTLTKAASSAVTVNYSVLASSTATAGGTDYTTLSGSVIVAANNTSATIDVTGVVDDLLVEGTETVVAQITSTNNASVTIGAADTATVNITDNDTSTASIATTTNASETGPANGRFTVTLTKASGTDVTVNYSVLAGSTATAGGTDYATLSGSVVVSAGATSAFIDVTGINDDALVEGTETVVVQITSTNNTGVTINAAADTATVNISDNDSASVSVATTTNANETGPVNGRFTVTMTAASGTDTTVNYNVLASSTATAGGTDYTSLSGSVVVSAGSTTAFIDVTGINDDALVEGIETVAIQLTGTSDAGISVNAAADTATINITDNDAATASIAATTNADETGPVNGQFTVTLTKAASSAVTVNYSVLASSTATAGGTDYTTLSGSVVVAANSTTATIDVTGIVDDAIVEGTETVVVQITSTSNALVTIGASDTATVNITDNDSATVSIATTTNANETGPVNGRFTVTMTAAASTDVVVNYSVLASSTATAGGTDYTTLTGTVTVPAGSTTANIDVTGINNDALVEGTETVVVQITSTNNAAVTVNAAANTATITITDNDSSVASIATTTNASETGPTNGRYTVSLTNAVSTAVTVNYSVLASSTATAGGTDYTTLSGSVTVPANNTSATIDVTGIVDDALTEGTETVVVQITSTSNAAVTINAAADTATVNITDNDTSQASVSTTTNASETGPTSGRFTVNFTSVVGTPVTVNYSVLASSTATAGGVDYTSLSGSVVVAAGTTSATIDVTGIVDDALIEGNETVAIQLTSTSSALVSINAAADTATVTIADNDVSGPGVTDANRSTATVSPAYVAADGTSTITVTITLRDVNGSPVSGSSVSVASSRGATDTVVQPAAVTDANGVTTATISSNTVGLSDLTITDTTFGIVLANPVRVAFNQGQLLTLTKSAAKSEAEIGEIIPYTVVIRNNTGTAVTGVNLNEAIPRGFKYVTGSSTLNGTTVADPSGSRNLIYSIGTVPALVDTNANGIADPGETGYVSLTYYLRVGSGVTPSHYINTSTATDICSVCSVANTADVMVAVSLDPMFDLGTIIGKVYDDRNRNGELDEGEPGVAGAMVVLDDGTYAVTDKHGRYHFAAIKPGQRLLKINTHALPGSRSSGSETKVVSVTQGLLVKANFGVDYQGGEDSIGDEGRIGLRVDTDIKPAPVHLLGSTRTFSVLVNGREAPLPVSEVAMRAHSLDQAVKIKGGQLVKPVQFRFDVSQPEMMREWRLLVRDSAGKTIRTLTGSGVPPQRITWDGRQNSGRLIPGGQIYSYEMEAAFKDGSIATSSRRLFGVDVTSAISLQLTGGAFETGSSRLSKYARRILKQTANTLRKYPNEKIVLEGHSDSRGAASTNLKLAAQRAQAARDYLVKAEKISPSRFVVRSFGEAKPIASNRTAEGRSLNRRVEVRGQASRIQKANLFDQFRRASRVTMNGKQIRIDRFGRFTEYVNPDENSALNFEVINDHGRSLKTRIRLPELKLDAPTEPLRVSYGEITEQYQVKEKPKSFLRRRRGAVMTYSLSGQTDPGNTVLLDGKRQRLDAQGRFKLKLDLRTGYNSYGLMVTNSEGYTRTANIILNVNARDRRGNALLAFEPVPNLKVNLPPHMRALKSEVLSFWGQTDAGNKVTVNGLPVKVKSDGQFNASVTLPKGKSMLVIEATDKKGYQGKIEREVNVGGTELFFLAFADGKFGQVSSKVQGGGSGDGDSYFSEGRLAFYAKGVIKGKYLLTASVDTAKEKSSSLFKGMTAAENKQMLSNIDPDKLYPVYGDSSTLVQDAAGQGEFYVALTSDELDLVVGNYAVKLEGNEVANYQRNLHGFRGVYRSLAKSKFGQPNTTVVLFAAEVKQIHITDEIRGTGGSLYYLSHRDLIEGSEQVSLVVRDQNTGLTLSKRGLVRGTDYEIRYSEGRLLFTWPVSSTQAGDTLIGDQPLSGNPVYLMVDYESKTTGLEKAASGGRVRKQLGDHLAVGATYVQDDTLGSNYELSGADVELRLSQKTRVVVESAQSQGKGGRKYVSEDGGVTYTETTATGTVSGQAWKVAAEVDISSLSKKLTQATAAVYMKRIEPGFETNQSTNEQGSQKVGVNADMQIGGKDQLRMRVDQEQLDTPKASGASTTDTASLQWMRRWGVWDLATEYRYRQVQGTTGNLLEHSSTAAAMAKWKVNEKFNLQFAHQQTLEGTENDLSTLGAEYQLLPNIALTGAVSSGTRGDSAEAGVVMKFGDSRLYIKERETHDANGANTTSIVGTETGIGDNSKLYSEYQWRRGDSGPARTSLLGARKQWGVDKGWKFLLSGEYADVYGSTTQTKRYAAALGISYEDGKRWKASSRDEYRREFGSINRFQWMTTNFVEYKLNTDFTVLGKYRYSITQNVDTGVTEGDLSEQSIGLAFRPVGHDRLNALGRYTHIGDRRPLATGETSQLSTIADIVSLEWSYDLSRKIEWVEKLAYKDKSVIDPIANYNSRTTLVLTRMNYRFRPDWDVGMEYRVLSNQDANDQKSGWLTELSWEMQKHMRLGVGYNFTDFSDNEFSDNNYSEHGWFLRVQGKF